MSEEEVVGYVFSREQADQLVTLRNHGGYDVLSALIDNEIAESTVALEHLGNSRDDDMYLKGVLYSFRWIIKLIEDAYRMVREEE